MYPTDRRLGLTIAVANDERKRSALPPALVRLDLGRVSHRGSSGTGDIISASAAEKGLMISLVRARVPPVCSVLPTVYAGEVDMP